MPAVEYDDLSRGRKQEIDLARRAAAKKAREAAQAGPGGAATFVDSMAGIAKLAQRLPPEYEPVRPRVQRQLDNKARAAQALADYEDLRDTPGLTLFEDPQASKEAGERAKAKVNPARRMEVKDMKKGGAVKGWGKARGARAAKVY
jgi:hypothetical protein